MVRWDGADSPPTPRVVSSRIRIATAVLHLSLVVIGLARWIHAIGHRIAGADRRPVELGEDPEVWQ